MELASVSYCDGLIYIGLGVIVLWVIAKALKSKSEGDHYHE